MWVQCCAKVLECSGQRHCWDRTLACDCWDVTGITRGPAANRSFDGTEVTQGDIVSRTCMGLLGALVPTPGRLLWSLIQQKPVWDREGSSDISSNPKSHFRAAVKFVPPIFTQACV